MIGLPITKKFVPKADDKKEWEKFFLETIERKEKEFAEVLRKELFDKQLQDVLSRIKGANKSIVKEEKEKTLSLFSIFKGGPGSGSWDGPGRRRTRKQRLAALRAEKLRRSGNSSNTVSGGKINISKYPKEAKDITEDMAMAQADLNDIKAQMKENLDNIRKGNANLVDVGNTLDSESVKVIVKNMSSELMSYGSYLAGDTGIQAMGFVNHFSNTLRKGIEDGSLEGISAKELNALGLDCVRKLVYQEIESNRQQFTDHGIRHLVGNMIRQHDIMKEMTDGRVKAKDDLIGQFIMINHDIGYTTPLVRSGGLRGVMMSGMHKDFSEKITSQQKSVWNEDKIFSEKEYGDILGIIKTHDSTSFDGGTMAVSTRLADNLSLFSEEKLPGMFKYVNGDRYLQDMGMAAKRYNDAKDKGDNIGIVDAEKEFRNLRKGLYKKIDSANLSKQLKRDLKAGVKEISFMTPKFTLGVLAGNISKIAKNKGGGVKVSIKYDEYDSFLQKYFDMGQKQTKKLLGDYGVKDFSKTEYSIGDGKLELEVIGAP